MVPASPPPSPGKRLSALAWPAALLVLVMFPLGVREGSWLNIAILALLYSGLAQAWNMRPDLGLTKDRADGKSRGWYDRLTKNWLGQVVSKFRRVPGVK